MHPKWIERWKKKQISGKTPPLRIDLGVNRVIITPTGRRSVFDPVIVVFGPTTKLMIRGKRLLTWWMELGLEGSSRWEDQSFTRHPYLASLLCPLLSLQTFYSQVSSPLLKKVTVHFPDGSVTDVTQTHFDKYFSGSELVVAGKVQLSDSDTLTSFTSASAVSKTHRKTHLSRLCTVHVSSASCCPAGQPAAHLGDRSWCHRAGPGAGQAPALIHWLCQADVGLPDH